MNNYFFPCISLFPSDLPSVVDASDTALRLRQWQTSTFDFATLGNSHNLHFSWHLLDIFMNACHLEIEIKNAENYKNAQNRVNIIQSMLYLQGIPPFIIPFGMTHPLRDYSGINYRDSKSLRDKLPKDLQDGFTSTDGTIEGWLHEPAFQSFTLGERRGVSADAFKRATDLANKWKDLEQEHSPLNAARIAFQTAPIVPGLASSLLHAWQGIEALFPRVSSEVSFRLALLISQLCAPIRGDRMKTYETAKRSYRQRSQAAHGNGDKLTHRDWVEAWDLLASCLSACAARTLLPSEEILTQELLG